MRIDGKPGSGRGTGLNVPNRFLERSMGVLHWEGIDEYHDGSDRKTRYVEVFPKTILNKVVSPDLGMEWSMNPYQGCEHGCAYCYARPTHEYWGYGAGADFERVILLKRNAADLFEQELRRPAWRAGIVAVSGNTDCYQPVERKEGITRALLAVAQRFGQPVSLITKNALVLRDLDILSEMAARRLAQVAISLTSLDEDLRRRLEPRTSTAGNRLKAMEQLTAAGVPVRVMVAPVIPGLNDHEVPALLKAAADAGALDAAYTVVRTNGAVGPVFRQWLADHVPDRAAKVAAQVAQVHGGAMNDSVYGRRIRGEGTFAESIRQTFQLFRRRYFHGRRMPPLDRTLFRPPPSGQLDLFGEG